MVATALGLLVACALVAAHAQWHNGDEIHMKKFRGPIQEEQKLMDVIPMVRTLELRNPPANEALPRMQIEPQYDEGASLGVLNELTNKPNKPSDVTSKVS